VRIRLIQEGLQFEDLDEWRMDLLTKVPAAADPGSSGPARDRLYSPPAASSEQEFIEDWKTLVEPELQHLFAGAVETFRRDIEAAEVTEGEDGPRWRVKLRAEHYQAWLNALNQARLALAARFGFDEAAIEQPLPEEIGEERDLARVQVAFYGFLQEILVQVLERG
jgi:hypothetical protein